MSSNISNTTSGFALAFALLLACDVNTACHRREMPMEPIGPDVKASFVIYFNSGVTQKQINDFSKRVLSRPRVDGRGDYLPEGVRTFLRAPSVSGHEAIAITFFPSATSEQRQALIHAVKAAPLVYKVVENVAPSDVKSL